MFCYGDWLSPTQQGCSQVGGTPSGEAELVPAGVAGVPFMLVPYPSGNVDVGVNAHGVPGVPGVHGMPAVHPGSSSCWLVGLLVGWLASWLASRLVDC